MNTYRELLPTTEACRHCGDATIPNFKEETRASYQSTGCFGTPDYRRQLRRQEVVLVCLACGAVHDLLKTAVS